MTDNFYHNPAAAGSKSFTPITLVYRSQWVGLIGAPKTTFLGIHGKIKNRISLGGQIFKDQTGPAQVTGVSLAYAYRIPVLQGKLSMGLNGTIFQYALDVNELEGDQPDDQVLAGGNITKVLPEANFGLYYTRDKMYIGVSAIQMLQVKMEVGPSDLVNRRTRHYFLVVGHKFHYRSYLWVEPSLLVKAVAGAPTQMDVNVRIMYDDLIWAAFSGRNLEALVIALGVAKNRMSIAYAYDVTFTSINLHSSGSHEILIGYKLRHQKPSLPLFY